MAVLLVKVAMNIHLGAKRIHQQLAGIIIEIERNVLALVSDLHPFRTLPALLPTPSHGAVVITGNSSHWSDHRVGTDRQAADFDEAQGSATNLGTRRIHNQALALQNPESAIKQVDSSEGAEQSPNPNIIPMVDDSESEQCGHVAVPHHRRNAGWWRR